jgi:hypothetical protein
MKKRKDRWFNSKIKSWHTIKSIDAGKEFKGSTATYFENLGTKIRYAETARHRQQALVEAKNQVIGKLIFILQNHEELKTHKQCKIWIKFLPKIIHEINEHVIITWIIF